MRKRYLEGSGWKWLDKYTSQYQHIDGKLPGYLCCVKIETVKEKRIVRLADRQVCLADNGYIWFSFLPDNRNWSMTQIIDQTDTTVEWYFDVTKTNSVDEVGIPYLDDLYLDVVLLPNSEIIILDEDELKLAFEHKALTKSEFDLAYRVRNEIIEKVIPDRYMLKLYKQYLNRN